MVESQPSKLLVASSILVSRSMLSTTYMSFRCVDFRENGVYGVQLISKMIENKLLNPRK
jgi:hypothetical protein